MVKSTYGDYFIDIQDISSPTRLLYIYLLDLLDKRWQTWRIACHLSFFMNQKYETLY